jgi:SAM-dependent methyltransferase
MTPPILPHTMPAPPVPPVLPIPRYLEQVYWWAYVHPRAVHLFEREWLINLILFGNYVRLRDAALAALIAPDAGAAAAASGAVSTPVGSGQHPVLGGTTLQLACVYGDITARMQQQLAPAARLDVIDILPVQLHNLARKLVRDPRVCLMQGDSSALAFADACYDQVMLFFLLHEQPEAVRRATLSEALRVVRPGGRVIIMDYHRPVRWHPLRPLVRLVFETLEPYAIDLWRNDIATYLPAEAVSLPLRRQYFFGGLYQLLVLTR